MAHGKREWQTTPVFLPQEPHEQCEKEKVMTLEDKPQVRRCPVCYWGDQRVITNSSRKKHPSAVDVSGGKSKVLCCKEKYCLGTWNVR